MTIIIMSVEDCNNNLVASPFDKASYYILSIVEPNIIRSIKSPRIGVKPSEYFAELGIEYYHNIRYVEWKEGLFENYVLRSLS